MEDEEKKVPEADSGDEKKVGDSGDEMGKEEFLEFIDTLKEQGADDEQILDILFKAVTDGDLDLEDLENAAGMMGYELKEEFKKELAGGGDSDEDEGDAPDKDQIEAAKEIAPGESKEEFMDRVEKGEEADDDEDREREEAMKLFGK